jgi:hypothetical protein
MMKPDLAIGRAEWGKGGTRMEATRMEKGKTGVLARGPRTFLLVKLL